MAINVSALPEYVNQHADELLTKAMIGATTLDYISIMPNVKYKDSLIYLSSTVAFQDAATCGFNAQGDDTLSQRTIEVKPIKVNKEYCPKDLRKTALNHGLLFEAGRETLPFEEKIIENNLNAINVELEKLIWQGDGYSPFNGIYEIMKSSEGIIDKTVAAGYTAIEAIDTAYEAMTPTMLIQDPVIFVSPSTFRSYIHGLNATCCANREIIDAASEKITYPGDSRVSIIPVPGMEGGAYGNYCIALGTPAKNLVYGTDVEGAENTFKFWYDEKEDKFMFKVLFNAGTQIKFPDQINRVHQA